MSPEIRTEREKKTERELLYGPPGSGPYFPNNVPGFMLFDVAMEERLNPGDRVIMSVLPGNKISLVKVDAESRAGRSELSRTVDRVTSTRIYFENES